MVDNTPPQGDENYISKAMQLMIKRKNVVRAIAKLDPDKDKDKIDVLRKQADDLYQQAQEAGGISGDEAQALALVH